MKSFVAPAGQNTNLKSDKQSHQLDENGQTSFWLYAPESPIELPVKLHRG